MEKFLDWAILGALVFTVLSLWRLARSMQSARKLHNSLKDDLRSFMTASEKTQTALNVLEEVRKDITRTVTKDRREAESLKEDLLYLIEQGKVVADRLEGSLHSLRPLENQKAGASKSAPKDLLKSKDLQKSLDKLR